MSELEAKKEDAAYPRKFGPYLLLNAFAHGGMGEVYLAKSGGIEGIDRLCVLKKLRPDVAKNKEYLGRFIDEARVVVQLSHANIAHVFDVGAVGDDHYMAMEYVSGANAREIQMRAADEEAHGLDTGLAGLIVCEMLDALDYAHRHKHPLTGKPLTIVHRDVSPQNVMVSFEGEVKLIDFGLAASELKEEQTESQVVMGKVAYMSPEQARGEDCDPKTDQFAAAMVLYELLAGERFYGEKNNYEIWQVVGKGGFVPRKFTELEPKMTRILSRALSPDKNMRYPTCGDFKDDLELYIRTQHPHATKRTLRELMERLFERDQQAERRFLSQYADVSAAQVRTEAPGKARSFVAKEGTSASVPPAEVTAPDAMTSDEASKSLPPHARTETAASHPELMDELDLRDDPPRRPEGTDIIERDLTGAAVREAYPESKRPLAAAVVVVVLLLLVVVGLLVFGGNKPSSESPKVADNTAVDPVGPSTGAPTDEGKAEPGGDTPAVDDVVDPGDQEVKTATASTTTARTTPRPRRRVSARPTASAEATTDDSAAKTKLAQGTDRGDPKVAKRARDATPAEVLHQELVEYGKWTPSRPTAQVRALLGRCNKLGFGLVPMASTLIKRPGEIGTKEGDIQLVDTLLTRCRTGAGEH